MSKVLKIHKKVDLVFLSLPAILPVLFVPTIANGPGKSIIIIIRSQPDEPHQHHSSLSNAAVFKSIDF